MRLDQWLFEEGYFDSREKARREILAGRVRESKSGKILDKPGQQIKRALEVSILERARFVSRAGDKLDAFLEEAGVDVSGFTCLDVGSSTGGFSDCLLQRGAKQILAVDVGTHQLHEKLRGDARIQLFEQTDIREFDYSILPKPLSLVTIDVSFISVRKFLPKLLENCAQSEFIILFKPQFEAGRYVPRKRGVVSEEVADKALIEMLRYLEQIGFQTETVKKSQVKGMKGNQETLIKGRLGAIPKKIFRTYDIRGEWQTDLSAEAFERIGYVLGKRIVAKSSKAAVVGIGRDSRVSSPEIFDALLRGLSVSDLKLVSLGETTTPMVYFANHQLGLDAAFQVTASHNPPKDNGLKMMIGKDTLFGEEIASIGDEAIGLKDWPRADKAPACEDWSEELLAKYVSYMHAHFQFSKKYSLTVDTANGMAGLVARAVFSKFAEPLDIIYEEVDCSFPNHPADPTVEENLRPLIEKVLENESDLGFSYDGDGDRLGLVTKKGRILWGDEILMLLSEKVLRDQPGSQIIGEVKCSERLFRMIRDRGGKPVMYRTGHSLIKKKMKEDSSPIAGEMSGHLFFGDRYFGFDDAIYGALRVIEVVDELGIDLDEWIEGFPNSFITPEIRVDCEEEEKESLVQGVQSYFADRPHESMVLIDGVRVTFEDGAWLLVRASNTQAVLVLRIEASSEIRLQELKRESAKALGRASV